MVELNLLPKHLRKRLGPDLWKTAAIAVPLVIFGLIAYLHITTSLQIADLEQQRATLQAEVNILKPYIAERNKLMQKKRQLEAIASVAREVRATYKPWSDYLAAFLTTLPKRKGQRLLVRLLSINARNISPDQAVNVYGKPVNVEFALRGEADGRQALIRFVRNFETNPKFAINFQNANYNKEKRLFNFSASVGMMAPEPKEARRAEAK